MKNKKKKCDFFFFSFLFVRNLRSALLLNIFVSEYVQIYLHTLFYHVYLVLTNAFMSKTSFFSFSHFCCCCFFCYFIYLADIFFVLNFVFLSFFNSRLVVMQRENFVKHYEVGFIRLRRHSYISLF